MPTDHRLDDIAQGITFLLKSHAGYTSQDLHAGIKRLQTACERMKVPGTAPPAEITRLCEEAKEAIRLTRARLSQGSD
jgi:hypothetical protein